MTNAMTSNDVATVTACDAPQPRPQRLRQNSLGRAVREAAGLLLLAVLVGSVHQFFRPKYSPQELAQLRAPVQMRTDEAPLPPRVPDQYADFGTVNFGKQIVVTFEYVNRSGSLQELDAAGSRGLAKVTLQGKSMLPPNDKVLVIATIDGLRTVGVYDDEILLFATGQETPVGKFILSGRFEQLIEVQPPTDGVSFGTVAKGTRAGRNVVLAELKPNAFQKYSWACRPDWLIVTEQLIVVRDDGTRVIDFLLGVPASAPQGTFRGEFSLTLDPERFDLITVPLSGKVQ